VTLILVDYLPYRQLSFYLHLTVVIRFNVVGHIPTPENYRKGPLGGRTMKKLSAILMGMVVLCAMPASACAQGWLGNTGTPKVYFGWTEHPKGSVWSLQRQTSTGTAAWPLSGFWLGARKDLVLTDDFGILISGSVFFPKRSAGTWREEPGPITFDFEIPQYDWWTLDGLAACRVAGDTEVLAGFRWDHTSTRVNYSDNTEDDYILNVYLPLFGMQLNKRFSNSSLLLRCVGSPWVGGRLKYHFWDNLGFAEFGDFRVNNGYFLELFADCSIRIARDVSAGGFMKWNYLHVKTDEQSLSGSTTEPVSWVVDVRSWTFGASLACAFASPF
jgi:hypothetical protein